MRDRRAPGLSVPVWLGQSLEWIVRPNLQWREMAQVSGKDDEVAVGGGRCDGNVGETWRMAGCACAIGQGTRDTSRCNIEGQHPVCIEV